ncbi:MAG: TetR/AcrR family transcriptional regulator, partial [Chloroflexota bacterium]
MREAQFHLLVAKWLSENDYYYEHEVNMPEYGRADFVAKHQDGHILLVECKIGAKAPDGRSIIQLVDYCRQLSGSRGGYAIPRELLNDKITALCALYNVRIIPIDVNQTVDPKILGEPKKGEIYKEKRNQAIAEEIKQIAHEQMAKEGIASLSLRAIARSLGVTAPALYRYFPNRDTLITTLITDAYKTQADALEFADKAQLPTHYGARVMAFALTYRRWVLDHPTEFQLLSGASIPDYHAPSDFTVLTTRRSFLLLVDILTEAFIAEKLTLTPYYQNLPEDIVNHIHSL